MRIGTLTFATILLAAPLASAQSLDRSEAPAMVAWVNQARAARGLAAVTDDPRLDAVAEAHSLDMAQWGYFSHQSPRTGNVEDRVTTAGIRWRSLGENIAFNQSPRAAHEALMRSPGHYANITGAYRSVGIGIVRTGEGVYVTEVFGTLLDSQGAAPPTTQGRTAAVPRANGDVVRPGVDNGWNGWAVPPVFQGLNLPGMFDWGAPAQAPRRPGVGARERAPSNAQRGGVRNCEVDTPFGHVSISIAGDGIDTSGLPCNPDTGRRPSQPQNTPGAPAQTRPPARHPVPRIEVPPVPRVVEPTPSYEPLGAPTTTI